ncbi:hypothetical protein NW768_012075 [Fusarium equiseti]|uniref:Uncharacterized protein n=1 Tax=Fusarium equiseti TaxID=61235 RepID=A0ABQ8QWB5_FUSEQ|nr:hypothetical protein NW768_012075 [Fusarium equiseti]
MGGWGRGDMSPDTVAIEYAINVVIEPISTLDSRASRELTAKKTIRFITKSTENPPLDVVPTSQRYTLQATQILRPHSFKEPTGTLSASATQPEPLRLHPYGKVVAPSFIDVSLTFDPSELGTLPTQPDVLSLSIRSYTWRQADPYLAFPDLHEMPSIKTPFCATLPVEYNFKTTPFDTVNHKDDPADILLLFIV